MTKTSTLLTTRNIQLIRRISSHVFTEATSRNLCSSNESNGFPSDFFVRSAFEKQQEVASVKNKLRSFLMKYSDTK